MAEESPLSNKRSITLTLSPQDPFSTIEAAVLDEPRDVSPEQSPKKPKPNSHDYPRVDFDEKLILETDSDVSEGFGVAAARNEVSGVLFGENIQSFGGLKGDVAIADETSKKIVEFDGNNGVLGVKMEETDVGFDKKAEIEENSSEIVHVPSKSDIDVSEVSGVVLGEKIQSFGGLNEFVKLSSDVSNRVGIADEISKKMVEFDGNRGVLGVKMEEKNIVHDLGSSKSQCNGTFEATAMCGNSNKSENVEHCEFPTCSLAVELVDETAVVDVLVNGGKKSRRRGRKGDSSSVVAGNSDGAERKMKYSRKEMQKMKFVNVKAQKKFWQEVYNGLNDCVKKEYSELCSSRHQKQGGSSHDQGILGDSSSGNVSCDTEMLSSTLASSNGKNICKDGDDLEWSEDEESDDEYHSIQRPAFMVQGDPDFESGPPEDGLEYLRRVRWEAAQIPKVKVVNLDRGKLKEQSVYMPKIPDIEKCPPHLAPLSQWEDEFIADFSELRLAISSWDDTNEAASDDSQTIFFGHPVPTKRTSKNLASLQLPAGGPTLSTILAMDPVSRVTLLNKRISLFANADNLPKDECAWLFALCAVVETPLDADTSASLRCLLRRCAKLRAEKSELDDEVVMLNLLATIAGKYFGQSEN